MEYPLIVICAILLITLAIFIGKYLYYTGSRKECDEEYSILLRHIELSSAKDSSIMQHRVSEFHQKYRPLVSYDFLMRRTNRLYSAIKYPRIYASNNQS